MKETKKHTKHTALIKPLGGEYHRQEWSIIGAPCGIIHKLAARINEQLKDQYRLGYLDAAHKSAAPDHDYFVSFTDKIDYQEYTTRLKPGQKQNRKFFNDLDLLIVNGNHFKGDKQIVLINERKKESLQRKLDRLTDVRMILVEKAGDPIHDYLQELVSADIPILPIDNTEQICTIIQQDLQASVPPVMGLVLAGGKSTRMGQDKGLLQYHHKPHREFLAELLKPHCEQVFLSFRKGQNGAEEIASYPPLFDTFEGLGPYGAILSAFRVQPNHAWLSLACDLPYMDEGTIQQLIEQRDPGKLATCFHNPETNFPEPLLTIWEPRAYPVLLEFLSMGYSCPRKVLINTDIKELEIANPQTLFNANHPQEYEAAKAALQKNNIQQ